MIYDIILNIEKSGIKPRIKVSQYDKTLPQIRATLYSNNQAFNIPSGSTVYISGTKKDNTGFKYECTYSNNEITADITEQMTAFSGDVEVEFTIENSGSRKGTENFILEVEKAALEDDVIISETDIPALQRLSQPASTTQLGVVKVDGTSVTIDEDGTLHSSGGGGGAVQSVNGKTGAVVLDADDIDDSSTTNKFTNATEKQAWNGKSTVSVTQIKSSGEKIATINVNGTDTDLYASAGGGGGGAVDSVNGKTGDVVLTASDVGALADNTPIPSDLSDLSDVDTSGVTDGQILKYNATSGKFLPGNESGGGTTDYTDLTNKPSINGVTLSGNKTSADLSIFAPTITSPTSGQVIKYDGSNWVNGSVSGGSNRNLLDNPWFTVNQKGFSSETITDSNVNIKVDRWNIKSSTVTPRTWTLNSNGLTCSISNSTSYSDRWRETYLVQYLEDISFLVGKTITMSVICNGELYSGSVYIANTTTTYTVKTANLGNTRVLELRIYMSTNSVGVSMLVDMQNYTSGSLDFTFKAFKLELGTESTLALDVAPNYTEELLKCQRYYVPLPRYWNGLTAGINSTYHLVNIELPTKMRAVPTISGSANIEGALNGASVMETIATSSMTVRNTDLQFIQIAVQSTNNYDKNGNVLFMPSSGAALSAEL